MSSPHITESPQRRQVANVAVILTGLFLVALAVWPRPATAGLDAMRDLRTPQLTWIVHGTAGLLSIGAFLLGHRHRWQALARGMLLVAALALFAVLLNARDFSGRMLLMFAIPALVLAASSFAFGAMPAPNET